MILSIDCNISIIIFLFFVATDFNQHKKNDNWRDTIWVLNQVTWGSQQENLYNFML